MASTANLRSRRSAAQKQALVGVEREIHAQDSHRRRKYLREFTEAFRTYESVLTVQEFKDFSHSADIVLIGDYHALAASQHCAANLFEQRAYGGDRPVVLGVETIFARDQHVLDEWWRREIDDGELRRRIRFDLDWGYAWEPFHELLATARDHGEALYGLDCPPRENLRQIGARDRHAAAKIAEIHQRHPGAAIMVLFGESHLAPGHLPRILRQEIPDAKILTILQNVDALYWQASGESAGKVEAVRVSDDVVCVFNATPLEKYESYRLFLDQWSRSESGPDFAPTVYNLIDTLAGFLGINRYSPHNTTQPKFLVDLLPEVHGLASDSALQRLLSRNRIDPQPLREMLTSLEEHGSAYVPEVNAFCVREFRLMYAAEDAARFLHHACRGLPQRAAGAARARDTQRGSEADSFRMRTIEHALADLGSRILYPARAVPEGQLSHLTQASFEKAAQTASRGDAERWEATSRTLGYRLGSSLYSAYLEGKKKPAELRRLFLAHVEQPEVAHKTCQALLSELRPAPLQ